MIAFINVFILQVVCRNPIIIYGEPQETGKFGESINYYYFEKENTTLINGSGAIPDYTTDTFPTLKGTTVIIDQGITTIGQYFAYQFTDVIKLIISETVSEIKNYAFYYDNNLLEIYVLGTEVIKGCSVQNTFYKHSPNAQLYIHKDFNYVSTQPIKSIKNHNLNLTYYDIGNGLCIFTNKSVSVLDIFASGKVDSYVNYDSNGFLNITLHEGITEISENFLKSFDENISHFYISLPSSYDSTTINVDFWNSLHGVSSIKISPYDPNYSSEAFTPEDDEIQYYSLLNKDKTELLIGTKYYLGSINVPSSVIKIHEKAFMKGNLRTLEYKGSAVEEIGDYAFYYAKFVVYCMHEGKTPKIGKKAFTNVTMENLIVKSDWKDVLVDESVWTKDETYNYTFKLSSNMEIGEDALTNISITGKSSSVTYKNITILDNEILSKISLNTTSFPSGTNIPIYLADSVNILPSYCFKNVNYITQIVGKNVTNVLLECFFNCNISTYDLPNLRFIGKQAFSFIPLTSFELPDSVETVELGGFYRCPNLATFKIGANLQTISYGMFWLCPKLESVIFGPKVQFIEQRAFSDCSKLTSIEFNSNILQIGEAAFANCTSLTSFKFTTDLTTIGDYAFQFCSKLNVPPFVLGEKFEYIGSYAFHGCSQIAGVTFNSLVLKNISNSTFLSCRNLKTVNLCNSIEYIGGDAFAYCSSLEQIVLPTSLNYLGDRAFIECAGLVSVDITSDITTLGTKIFYLCQSITSIDLSQLSHLGNLMFYACKNITEVNFGDKITTIPIYAFSSCSIRYLEFPNQITSIGENSFYGLKNCEYIKLNGNIKTIPNGAFAGIKMDVLYLDANIDVIEKGAFSSCTFTELILLNVNQIAENAFSSSTIDYIYLGKGVQNIDKNAFKTSNKDDKITICLVDPSVMTFYSNSFNVNISAFSFHVPRSSQSVTKNGLFLHVHDNYFEYGEISGEKGQMIWIRRFHYKPVSQTPTYVISIYGDGKTGEFADLEVFNRRQNQYPYTLNITTRITSFNSIVQVLNNTERIIIGKNVVDNFFDSNVINKLPETIKSCSVNPENPYYTTSDNILYSKDMRKLIYCPPLCFSPYYKSYIIPDGVKTIGEYSFYNATFIKGINISDSVEVIGEHAFGQCKNLAEVEIGYNVYNIGDGAFQQVASNVSVFYHGFIEVSCTQNAFDSSIKINTSVDYPYENLCGNELNKNMNIVVRTPVATLPQTPAPTPKPSSTPLPTATQSPTASPFATPTESATASPSKSPTATPLPTFTPTESATQSATKSPTATPLPTFTPTESATQSATKSPTKTPSQSPTEPPTKIPSQSPTPIVITTSNSQSQILPPISHSQTETNPSENATIEQTPVASRSPSPSRTPFPLVTKPPVKTQEVNLSIFVQDGEKLTILTNNTEVFNNDDVSYNIPLTNEIKDVTINNTEKKNVALVIPPTTTEITIDTTNESTSKSFDIVVQSDELTVNLGKDTLASIENATGTVTINKMQDQETDVIQLEKVTPNSETFTIKPNIPVKIKEVDILGEQGLNVDGDDKNKVEVENVKVQENSVGTIKNVEVQKIVFGTSSSLIVEKVPLAKASIDVTYNSNTVEAGTGKPILAGDLKESPSEIVITQRDNQYLGEYETLLIAESADDEFMCADWAATFKKGPFKSKFKDAECINITRERSSDFVTQLVAKAPKSDGKNNNGSKLSGGAIAGIVIGVVVVVGVVVFLVLYFLVFKKKNNASQSSDQDPGDYL